MKKVMTFVLLALFATTGFSQVSWNAKAGLNLSEHYGSNSTNAQIKPGFRVGVGMEYAFNEMVSLQPTLYFSTKGSKYKEVANVKNEFNQMYLEMPIDVQLRFNVADNTNFIVAAGPYIAYGIGGKYKVTTSGVEAKVNCFGTKDGALDLNRFDAGINVGVGMEFGSIIAQIDTDLGLCKIKDGAPKNLNFGVTLGYKF